MSSRPDQKQPSTLPSNNSEPKQEIARSILPGDHNIIKLKLAHSTAVMRSPNNYNQGTIQTQKAIAATLMQRQQKINNNKAMMTTAPSMAMVGDSIPTIKSTTKNNSSSGSKTTNVMQLLARIWILAFMAIPQVTATAKKLTGTSDYMPEIISPYDANHRALLEATPSHICIEGKKHKHFPNNDNRQCHPLLAGYSRDLDTGSVCVELVSDPPQLKVTFETSGDWALVRTKFWAGSSIEQVPTITGTTEIDLDDFDYYYSNYTGYKRWIATAALTERCDSTENSDEDKHHFRVSMVAHAEVEQVDAYAHMIPGTQQVAYAYDNTVDSENEWYGWFDFKVSTRI